MTADIRRLHLLRHAKSSWADADLPDHRRPLNARGKRAARTIRDHLDALGIAPALVVCSSATRTVMTLEAISNALPASVVVEIDDDVYGAPAIELLHRVRAIAPTVPEAMLIAHNPGIQDLASMLAGSGDSLLRARLEEKFPTAALATLRWTGPWTALADGCATLEQFVVPRDLD